MIPVKRDKDILYNYSRILYTFIHHVQNGKIIPENVIVELQQTKYWDDI